MSEPQLTPSNIRFPNDTVERDGFCAPGKSLITEIEKLKEAVLMLCDLQREVAAKLGAALPTRTDGKAA